MNLPLQRGCSKQAVGSDRACALNCYQNFVPAIMFVRASLYIRPFGLQKRRFASVASEFRIPVIDFSKFRAAKSDAEKKDTANEIVSAFKNSGFIYISNQ